MYYATFKGIGKSDIAEFKTKQDRDNWVNFKDSYSLAFGTTKENATFQRYELTDEKELSKVVNDKNIERVVDTYNPNQWWILRSIA